MPLHNKKSGISLSLSGVKGTDWVSEDGFYDPGRQDRPVIFAKPSVEMSLAHNERNVCGYSVGALPGSQGKIAPFPDGGIEAVPGSGEKGIIRYKIDGDLDYKMNWVDLGGTPNVFPAFSAPLRWDSLTYAMYGAPGTAALGTTGWNGHTPSLASKGDCRHYGIASAWGEAHLLSVADDDALARPTADSEWKASDGRLWIFVLNPVVPALLWSASGGGKFQRTPFKNYYLPVTHDERETRFAPKTGAVSCEIVNIMGGDVHYRIVTDRDDAVTPYTDAGADRVILTDDDFDDGLSYLQCYYAGQEGNIRTERVRKNPAHPSAGEEHGGVFVGGNDRWAVIESKIQRAPFKGRIDYDRAQFFKSQDTWTPYAGEGWRVWRSGLADAFYARLFGLEARSLGSRPTFAATALSSLMDHAANIDFVGQELGDVGTAHPCRERANRGYYNVPQAWTALAYDILCSCYLDTHHPDGMDAIDNYFIRDSLACWALDTLRRTAGMATKSTVVDAGGMWDTSEKTGVLAIALCLPSYSESYAGTSGVDGNTQTWTWLPFKDQQMTWINQMVHKSGEASSVTGYPNLNTRGVGWEEYMFTADGNLDDRINYWNNGNLVGVFQMYMIMIGRHFPAQAAALTRCKAALLKSQTGTIRGTLTGSETRYNSVIGCINGDWPESAATAYAEMISRGREATDLDAHALAGIAHYDDYIAVGSTAPVQFSPAPGEFEEDTLEILMSCQDAGAVIQFTTTGDDPDEESDIYDPENPPVIGVDTTVKAIATAAPKPAGGVTEASYTLVDIASPRITSALPGN